MRIAKSGHVVTPWLELIECRYASHVSQLGDTELCDRLQKNALRLSSRRLKEETIENDCIRS